MILDAFQFLDPGPLRDDDLQLVAPEARWIDDFLAACHHPLTRRDAYPLSCVTRHDLQQFLHLAPFGREPGDLASGRVPTYHYWMLWHDAPGDGPRPLRMAGAISLRIGSTHAMEMYYGHVGYHVYPAARGRRFAERACRAMIPLARAHGMNTMWITCNPDNYASRKTCERLNARLVEIVPVPLSDPLYARGDHEKCRYRLDLRR